jgi:integrase
MVAGAGRANTDKHQGIRLMGRGPGVRVVGPEAIQLDFRWHGRQRPRVRLSPTKANVRYCQAWKRRIEDEIALGTFVWEKHFPNLPNPCVVSGSRLRDVVLAYIESLAGQVQPETAKEYEQCATIVCKGLGNPPLEKLTRAKLREWVSKQKLSKARIDNLLTPIRGALKQAVEDGTIESSPLEGFEVRRIGSDSEEGIDPFTPEEIEALGKTELGSLWTFWAWTGLRSGEVIGLVWGDVAAECESVTVRRAVRRGREKGPKTAAGIRVLRLLAPARSSLLGSRPTSDLNVNQPVFRNPNTGNDWHEAKALNRAFARACRNAKVRRRYVYQLRHTFATWALSAGENPAWIAKQMGHKDVQVIYDHYAKWMGELDKKAGSRMVKAVRSKAA